MCLVNADLRGVSSKKGKSTYQSFGDMQREKEQRLAEEERRKKAMEDEEKLRPVTLMRSKQGHRFIRKVPKGDEAMQIELDH